MVHQVFINVVFSKKEIQGHSYNLKLILAEVDLKKYVKDETTFEVANFSII